uniref:hypothetical protein n=1 Tax=Orrella sp. TaxID=1921583 RepID=UPI004048A149
MTDRSTCWSITINNPTEEDLSPTLPAGWKMSGQLEQGEEKETEHYQGMVTTPQVRFSAVKKVFPRAHIEVAKNRVALARYVHKDDTRLEAVPDKVSNIPTLFDYQHEVARKWNDDEWRGFLDRRLEENPKASIGDLALEFVDDIVALDIEAGKCGVEYIAINPMWRSAWKKFWRQMVKREKLKTEQLVEDE